jgi:predicted PurR-regulated permease PerM
LDGRRLVLFFRHNSFFTPKQTNQLIDTLEASCRSVLLASLVSGSAQAIFESFVVIFAGVPNFALIGVVVFISSFIPVVGTAPVTFGLAIQQYVVGNTGAGIALFISAIVVSVMDNLIRPWFLRGSVNLHPLLAFVAAFGGLQTLGFAGVFLGPIIAALFVVTVQLLAKGREA